jgi:hypothetical protein
MKESHLVKKLSLLIVGLLIASTATAQGLAGDLLAGKLLKPRVGQWAWYDLIDTKNNTKYVVREAIVGKEKVGRKTAYWLEIEVVPEVGYKTIMKALLTGPASDQKNIKRIILKDGLDAPKEMEVLPASEIPKRPRPKRESVGMEDVLTLSGAIRAERFRVTEGSEVMDVWINKDVLPTGIVRLRSTKGQWTLRSYGKGGDDGKSAIDLEPAPIPRDTAEEGDAEGENE